MKSWQYNLLPVVVSAGLAGMIILTGCGESGLGGSQLGKKGSLSVRSDEWAVSALSRETVGRDKGGTFVLEDGVLPEELRYDKKVDRLLKIVLRVEPMRADSTTRQKQELGDLPFMMATTMLPGGESQAGQQRKAFYSRRVRLLSGDTESAGYCRVVGDTQQISFDNGLPVTFGLLPVGEAFELTCYFGIFGSDDDWILSWYDLPPIPVAAIPAAVQE